MDQGGRWSTRSRRRAAARRNRGRRCTRSCGRAQRESQATCREGRRSTITCVGTAGLEVTRSMPSPPAANRLAGVRATNNVAASTPDRDTAHRRQDQVLFMSARQRLRHGRGERHAPKRVSQPPMGFSFRPSPQNRRPKVSQHRHASVVKTRPFPEIFFNRRFVGRIAVVFDRPVKQGVHARHHGELDQSRSRVHRRRGVPGGCRTLTWPAWDSARDWRWPALACEGSAQRRWRRRPRRQRRRSERLLAERSGNSSTMRRIAPRRPTPTKSVPRRARAPDPPSSKCSWSARRTPCRRWRVVVADSSPSLDGAAGVGEVGASAACSASTRGPRPGRRRRRRCTGHRPSAAAWSWNATR